MKIIALSIAFYLNSLLCLSQNKIENKQITLSFEKKELEYVFQNIEKEQGVPFAFRSEIGKIITSGTYTRELLLSVIEKITSKNGLEYKIVGGQIVIKKKESASTSNPKPKQNIRGQVYDEHFHFGLPGATIKIIDSNPVNGTVTSENGTFEFESLPIGRYNLEISFVGYLKRIENIILNAGKEVVLNIGLIEDVNQLNEIVVSAYKNRVVPTNLFAVVSARSISTEETQRFAGSLSDPARMALSYAGVTSSNGYTNEIIVRGNSPRGLLWRLEGIEIPNPNHYGVEGSSGGFINILNSSNIARSDFFMSAFPAEFGNANSGIFDLKMRKGNTEKKEHSIEISSLGLRASTEGPLGKENGSYIVNYRYSTLGLIGNFAKNYDFPAFQDLTFKLTLPTKGIGNFSLFGLSGKGKWDQESSVGYLDDNQQEITKSWHDVQHYDLGIIGASHSIPFKNNTTFIESVVSISATQNRPSSSDFNYDNMEPYLQEQGKYINSAYRVASTLNHKFSAGNLLTTGIKLNHLKYNLDSESGLPDGTITKDVKKDGSGDLAQAFLSWQLRPSNLWVINTGIHLTYFSLSNELIAEPRLGIERNIKDNQTLSFGAGLHSRHESIATYFGESTFNGQITQPNRNLKMNRAAHFVLGYNLAISENLHLKTELYMQHQFAVPVENNLQSSYSSINQDVSFTTKELVNKGVGKNYGIEITLEKNYSNQFYFLATASLFDSKYKALDDIWRNTRYNVNYATNLIGGKEFSLGTKKGKSKALGVNFRGAISGGKRVTPINLEQSITSGYEVEITELAYTQQLSEYYRLDFSIYYNWEKKSASHQLKLDILNLLSQNIFGIRYVQAKFGIPAHIQEYSFNEDDEKQSNIFPVFSYKVNF
jgi:hypothetical protein